LDVREKVKLCEFAHVASNAGLAERWVEHCSPYNTKGMKPIGAAPNLICVQPLYGIINEKTTIHPINREIVVFFVQSLFLSSKIVSYSVPSFLLGGGCFA
jgi:hypothetical protein